MPGSLLASAHRARGACANGTPNLFSALPVAILCVRPGVDIRIDADGDARGRARCAAATSLSALSSGSDSTLKPRMPASSANAISPRVLPTPGEDDLLGRHAGRQRAPELALGHHVHAGAEPGQRGEHAEIGVGLDRIADERVRRAGEGVGEHPVVPLSVALNSNRTAFRPRRRARQGHVLGVEHAFLWERRAR